MFFRIISDEQYQHYQHAAVRVAELEAQLIATSHRLEETSQQLEKTSQQLEETSQRLEAVLEPNYADDCVAVDWEGMRVVSIERFVSPLENSVPYTILGYPLEDGRMGEWNLYISIEAHRGLVTQFKEYLKK